MPNPTRYLTIDEYDAHLIHWALKKRLEEAQGDLRLLQLTRERDLTDDERGELPSTLQTMTREQLLEQLHSWIGLCDHIDGVLQEFNPDLWKI